MDPLRILIADDHTLFREGLRSLLASVADTEVVGEAATGQDAIAQAAALQQPIGIILLLAKHIAGPQKRENRETIHWRVIFFHERTFAESFAKPTSLCR